MPRANRIIIPGCLYHLTHRCHDRRFLFRFGLDRTEYRTRLRQAASEFSVSLLACCITSNHTHLLVESGAPDSVSRMMQKLEGEFAEWYNRRRNRSGAFWEDRYHCTMIGGGAHAFNCIRYIDLNMVRAGAVNHPGQWKWCSYDELTGRRKRYRLLDRQAVMHWLGYKDADMFVKEYESSVALAIQVGELKRRAMWTESIAVGDRDFVESVASAMRNRRRLHREEVDDGVWAVREDPAPYN